MPEPVPAAIPLECPTCGEETTHDVLRGTVGLRGEYTLDAVVRCQQCQTTRHVVHREPGERTLPVILSKGADSRRTTLLLGDDEEVAVGDEVVIDGIRSMITGIEEKEGTRQESAVVPVIQTLWAKEFETVRIPFAINLGKKTAAKVVEAQPEEPFTVGEERTFGRLRVTIHAIKGRGKMHHRGALLARDIVRVFARPTKPPAFSRDRRCAARQDPESWKSQPRRRQPDRPTRPARADLGPRGPPARRGGNRLRSESHSRRGGRRPGMGRAPASRPGRSWGRSDRRRGPPRR